MTKTTPNLANIEPFEVVKRPDDPSTDPLKMEATVYPASKEGEEGADLPHARWAADLSDEHINPKWDERFEVVTGEYRVVSEEIETTLTEGDDVILPANVPHRHWNPSSRPARIRFEVRPALQAEEAFETIYTLAQAGHVGESGLPHLLQFAVIQDTYPGYFYSTDLPRSLQRAMFNMLAPIGRRLGYRATHSRNEIERLR